MIDKSGFKLYFSRIYAPYGSIEEAQLIFLLARLKSELQNMEKINQRI